MAIQAAEISAILRDQIKNFGQEAQVAEVGRVSMIWTRSPMPHWLVSSCALSLLVRRMTLP